MVQEELGQKTEMLTIDLAKMTIDFENRDIVFAVNLIARWLRIPPAFGDVTFEYATTLHVFQAKLANEEFRQAGVLLRVRSRIPSLNLKHAKLDSRWISSRRRVLLIEDRLKRLHQALGPLASLPTE